MKILSRRGALPLLFAIACSPAFAQSSSTATDIACDFPHSTTVSPADSTGLALALAEAAPGTLIRLSANTYAGNFTAAAAGTAAKPIILCGSRSAVLDGGGIDSGYGLHLSGATHWILSGFTVVNSKKGVVLDGAPANRLTALSLHRLGEQGALIRGASAGSSLDNSEIYDIGRYSPSHGVAVLGDGNTFSRNAVTLAGSGYGFYVSGASAGNLVACDNVVKGALSGFANVPCGAVAGPVAGVLRTDVVPARNFDLTHWKLTLPSGDDVQADVINGNYQVARVFYTDPVTGGMVFRCPNIAGTTANTHYSRTELREMLSPGSSADAGENNWTTADGGTLKATLRVDRVSTTGDPGKVGRVIIGQIHGPSSEPIRLYFHKLPGEARGRIYAGFDTASNKSSFSADIVGNSGSAGIALGEKFSYEIRLVDTRLTVKITPASGPIATQASNIDSAYRGLNLYFKAGVYNQNNTGDASDYVQATFFSLAHTHP